MKPPVFDYIRAQGIDEALDALAQHGGEARIIAGGQSLMPMLNMRLARPQVVVDIMRLRELASPAREKDMLVVPAGVRQGALLADAGAMRDLPLLAQALPWVGHVQTRARGTLCGSVAHADPSAEIPLCLVALGGEVRLRSRKARRRVPAADFFMGMMTTARADDEMIEAIALPMAKAGHGYAFNEIGRRHGDFAIVACAAVARADGVRLAVGGVADTPRAIDLPALDGTALDDALNAFAWSLGASDDLHASARYRRSLVRKLGAQTIREAQACRV